MDPLILQFIGIFLLGFILGLALMLIINKVRSGSVSAGGVKQEYDEYKTQVEAHFEETSKKFKEMTEQYQDLYKHLAVGATSLCRPDSVAAALADSAPETAKLENKAEAETTLETVDVENSSDEAKVAEKTEQAVKEPVDDSAQDEVATADDVEQDEKAS